MSSGNDKENMMKFDLTIHEAHLQAQKMFVVQSVLKMMPEPHNKDLRDLERHVKRVLFGRYRQ